MLIYWANTNGGEFDTAADWDTDQVPPSNQVPGAGDIAAMVAPALALYTVDDNDGAATTVAAFATGPDTIFEISNDSSFSATEGTGTGVNAGEVAVEDESALDVGGALDNTGGISLNSTGHFTTLTFLKSTSMTGGGQIDLSDSGDNIIQIGGGAAPVAIITNVNNTIQGGGKIISAASFALFINDKNGVVDADGGPLTVAVGDDSEFLNSGSLTATFGGTLLFTNGTLINVAGADLGSDDGAVEFQGETVAGGTFSTNTALDQGIVEFLSTNNELLSFQAGGVDALVTNDGALALADGASVAMAGVIDDNGADGGTIDLEGSAALTDLIVGAGGTGQLTLTGSGKVDLSDSDQNYVTAASGMETPTELINVNNDISGRHD